MMIVTRQIEILLQVEMLLEVGVGQGQVSGQMEVTE